MRSKVSTAAARLSIAATVRTPARLSPRLNLRRHLYVEAADHRVTSRTTRVGADVLGRLGPLWVDLDTKACA